MEEGVRTRKLRKYEAEARIVATAEGLHRLDLYAPFGPMIGRSRLPQPIAAAINTFADSIVSPDASSEFSVPEHLVFGGGAGSLAAWTSERIRDYYLSVEGTEIGGVEIENFWIVSQYAGTPSPVHFHSGDVSGVAYLRLPTLTDPEAEAERTYISGRQAGQINFIIGGKQPLAKSVISFAPAPGDFYLFPAWLLHGAEPFRGTGERRSMAFNANVVS